MPSVLPPSGSNPNRPNGPSGQIKVEIPGDILNLITDSDDKFKKKLVKQYGLDKPLSLGQMKQKIDSTNPYDLTQRFFHYIAALPLLAKTINFAEPNNEFTFFNNFIHFTMSSFPDDKVQSDKRTQLALLYLLLQTKSKTKTNQVMQDLLEKIINFVVNNLFHLSMPANISLSGQQPFNARSYLDGKLLEIASIVGGQDLKSDISSVLKKISKGADFQALLEEVSDHATSLEEIRVNHPDFNYDQSVRNQFDFRQNQALSKKVRAGFDQVISATEGFIACCKNKTGFNGKFVEILKDDLGEVGEVEFAQDISVNFSAFDEDDLDLLKKQSQVTIDTMKDLIGIGYKNFGFANFLSDYGFTDFAGFLLCQADMNNVQVEKMILDFLSPDNKSREFKVYSALDSLNKPNNPYVELFIDFLDKLKKVVLEGSAKVEIFPIDNGIALSEWDIEDSVKRVYFNNNNFVAQDPDTYNMNFNLFKFNPNEKYITDEDLERCCITTVWDENEFVSIEFVVPDALPFVIMELASKVQQKISDGDSFTLAGVEDLNQFVKDSFSEADAQRSDDSACELCVLPVFTRDDSELEPDLYRIFFVEAKDDDDGEPWSESKVPDGSLSLR